MDYQHDYSLQTLNQYAVNIKGSSEVLRQRLYDFQLYNHLGAAQFSFFSLPVGQGVTSAPGAVVGSAKTYADTNMELAGQLARPKNYLIESIEVLFEPGSSAAASTFVTQDISVAAAAAAAATLDYLNDINTVGNAGWLELLIGNKLYMQEGPLKIFPPKVRIELDGAIGNSDTTTHNEVAAMVGRWGGRPYYLEPPLTLEMLQNFSVTVKFPGAVATKTNNGRIGVVFDGVMYRNSQ